MYQPLISIIVPIYNSEKYLYACIDSILKQSYCNIELLLVDDGSTDSSYKIAKEFCEKDNRTILLHQENAGVSAARNKGLNFAQGEYIAFVDSDDELFNYAIEFLYKDIKEYGADMASAVKCVITKDGNAISQYNDGKIHVYNGNESLIQSLMYERQTNSVCAKLFSKKLVKNIRFSESRCINEDGYFLFQCYAKYPKVVQHNKNVYKYYIRENSNSRGVFSKKYFDMLHFSDLKMEYIKNMHPELLELAKNMEVSTHLFFLEVLCRDISNEYKGYEKRSIRLIRKRYGKYNTINKHEKIMATIVTFGLYPIYRFLFKLKYGKNYR